MNLISEKSYIDLCSFLRYQKEFPSLTSKDIPTYIYNYIEPLSNMTMLQSLLINNMEQTKELKNSYISFITKTSELISSSLEKIKPEACKDFIYLESINFPNLIEVPNKAFFNTCKEKKDKKLIVKFPKVKIIQDQGFAFSYINTLILPSLETIFEHPFNHESHNTVYLSAIDTLVLPNSKSCDWINKPQNEQYRKYALPKNIYVPKVLQQEYINKYGSSINFKAIEDYPDIQKLI